MFSLCRVEAIYNFEFEQNVFSKLEKLLAIVLYLFPLNHSLTLSPASVSRFRKMQLIAHIPHALDTDTALKVHASAKKVGRAWTAAQWTKMHCNVCPIAVDTGYSIWTHRHATANRNGVAMIVQKVRYMHKIIFIRVHKFMEKVLLFRSVCVCVCTILLIVRLLSPSLFPSFFSCRCCVELCDLNCGAHGRCVGETCTCDSGWGGEYCNTKLCDPRCNEHGQCKNGTCLCVTGWNGKHCTIEGCPASCSNHGQCRVSGEGLWECRCYDGWDGVDCSVALEQNCADNKDNDKGTFYTLLYFLSCSSCVSIVWLRPPPGLGAMKFVQRKM